MKRKSLRAILVLALLASSRFPLAAGPAILHHQPATDWQSECLPIGNGRLGAMIFGGIEREHIQFNEDTVWIGDEQDTGAYQAFGDLFIGFETDGSVPPVDYQRRLDLGDAVHTITYRQAGITFRREYFARHPANVLVLRFTADRPGAHSGTISLADAHDGTVRSAGNTLSFSGTLWGKHSLSGGKGQRDENYGIRLDYEARAVVLHEGGTLAAKDGGLRFDGCDALTILLDGGTDYLNRHDRGWKGAHPGEAVAARLARASAQ